MAYMVRLVTSDVLLLKHVGDELKEIREVLEVMVSTLPLFLPPVPRARPDLDPRLGVTEMPDEPVGEIPTVPETPVT